MIPFGHLYKKKTMSKLTIHDILLIDKSDIHKELIEDAFRNHKSIIKITQVENTSDVLKSLNEQHWQCILLAIDEIPLSITQLLEQMPGQNKNSPIIVLLNDYHRESALRFLTEGVFDVSAFDELDYLVQSISKGLKTEELSHTLTLQRNAIKAAHDRFRALTTQLPMAIAFLHEGAFINVNPEFQHYFKLESTEDLAETSFLDLIDTQDVDRIKKIFSQFNKDIELNNEKVENIKFNTQTDNTKTADIIFTRTNINQESGIQIIVQPHLEKIIEESVSTIDDENSLLSPEFFIQTLNQVIRNRNKDQHYALCFFEIDEYAKYKKRIGITRSDNLFHQISEFMTTLVNPNLQISQLNIDVFTVLLKAESRAACEDAVTHLQQTISQHNFIIDEQKMNTKINLGLVHISKHIENPDQALSLADVACTVSRNKNLHLMHVYTQNEDRSTVETVDFSWTGRIKDALKNDNFKLVYQPILHIKNEPTPLYEALLRMKSSRGDDILPGQFLHTAKQSGQEEDIDKWVINQILQLLESSTTADTSFFINLSETSINSIEFISWILENCKNYGQHIVFEITEHHALQFESEVLHFIQEVKKINCQICIEHYGNQPDASETLVEMDADYYKIDGAFINHLATNRKHQSIIHNIVHDTKDKNVKTIACFVQDADSLAILWREGVDYIQGNYLQIPNSQLSYKFEAQI